METRHVRIELDESEYRWLKDYKEEHGLTWEGVLKAGVYE